MNDRLIQVCLLNLRNVMYVVNRKVYASAIDIIDFNVDTDCLESVKIELHKIGAERPWRQA